MIDVKRLRVDAGYWAAVAPEWADSYGLAGVLEIPVWFNGFQYKHVGGVQVGHTFSFEEQNGYASKAIRIKARRPVEQKPEWDGSGLPTVGTECECLHRISTGEMHWVKCDVIGPYGDYVICAPNDGGFYGFDANELRPIRTQAQREREEIIKAAIEACPYPGSSTTHIDVEALYEAGMLRRAVE